MTKVEAEAVARAAAEADGGCPYCAEDVAKALNVAKLGWRWRVVRDEEVGWIVAVIQEGTGSDFPASFEGEEGEP